MRLLTKHGFLIEEQDRTYITAGDRESALLPLQAASCTYRGGNSGDIILISLDSKNKNRLVSASWLEFPE